MESEPATASVIARRRSRWDPVTGWAQRDSALRLDDLARPGSAKVRRAGKVGARVFRGCLEARSATSERALGSDPISVDRGWTGRVRYWLATTRRRSGSRNGAVRLQTAESASRDRAR